jgi:hypothetical protein
VAPGIHCSHAAGVAQRIAEGFTFCAMASELRYTLVGLAADLARLEWQRSAPVAIAADGQGATVRY